MLENLAKLVPFPSMVIMAGSTNQQDLSMGSGDNEIVEAGMVVEVVVVFNTVVVTVVVASVVVVVVVEPTVVVTLVLGPGIVVVNFDEPLPSATKSMFDTVAPAATDIPTKSLRSASSPLSSTPL